MLVPLCLLANRSPSKQRVVTSLFDEQLAGISSCLMIAIMSRSDRLATYDKVGPTTAAKILSVTLVENEDKLGAWANQEAPGTRHEEGPARKEDLLTHWKG